MPAKQRKRNEAADHAANVRRARAEVAGPELRRAIEPVYQRVKAEQDRMGWRPGTLMLMFTEPECAAIIAACERADKGVT